MKKLLVILLIILMIILSFYSFFNNLGFERNSETGEIEGNNGNLMEKEGIEIIEKVGENIENLEREGEYFCNVDSDCRLVIAGCLACIPCGEYSLDDSNIIAVNFDKYSEDVCPPDRHTDVYCPANCAIIFNYDSEKDAVCVSNKCVKRF